jgi:phenylalanyl-tRNA synthetase beta chain
MKVSLNLAQYYSNVNLEAIPHDILLQRVGEQLGAIEEVIDYAPMYKNIVVAKIVTVTDHPDADRLHVCTIDDGGVMQNVNRDQGRYVQVVCGAPNVREGMFVAWIPPGATVPSTYGSADEFVLEARDLRGVISNGMLASAKELSISEDHHGILEIIPEEVDGIPKPGEPLTDYFGLDDFVIDCENKMFTHRPDCFGNLGVARELAGISGLRFRSPDWYLQTPEFKLEIPEDKSVSLKVTNNLPKLVPRFMAVAMTNVTVKKSPIWLQTALKHAGIATINNVVDVANFVMHLTGQPLHAYDADKLREVSGKDNLSLEARMSKKTDTIALLNGKEVTIEDTETMLITSNDIPVGIAGIMGGSATEVDFSTKNIVIEVATFDMYAVRRASMRHGLFTDASTRYTKGQSPLQNDRVLWFAMAVMQKMTGAVAASAVEDVHDSLNEPNLITISASFINERLGSNLSLKDITKLLENVEFNIMPVPADKNRLHLRPPFWRTDLELPEDIVEEVGRLYGYDKLPIVLPARLSRPTTRNQMLDFKQSLRTKLAAVGANEVLGYSFVHGDLLRKIGVDPDTSAYHVRNAISPDLQYYRTSLMPNLLDKVRGNIRADLVRSEDNDFALFEIGKAHIKEQVDTEGLPLEFERLAFVFAADSKTAARKYEGAPFYQAKQYLLSILQNTIEFVPLKDTKTPLTAPYQLGRSASIRINSETIGTIGEFNQQVKKALKLPDFTAGFEIDVELLKKFSATKTYSPVSQFPKIQQDITLETDHDVSYQTVYLAIHEMLQSAAQEQGYQFSLVPRDIFQPENSEKKRITMRIWLSHTGKTLVTAEANKLLSEIAESLKDHFKIERI